MDKKIDLNEQHSTEGHKEIKISPNATNKVTLNFKNVAIGKKKPNLNNKIPFIKSKNNINYYRRNNIQQNPYQQNYNDDAEYDDESEENDVENNDALDESENSINDDINDAKDELKDQTKEKIQDQVKEKIKDQAKEKAKKQVKERIKKQAERKIKRETAKKITKKIATSSAKASAKAAVTATTAAAGGTVAGGWIVLLILLIILIICVIIAFIVTIFSGAITYHSKAINKYGQTCPIVKVINTDYNESTGTYTNKYNGEIDIETYVAGVVAASSIDFNNPEYLKLIATLARTYAYKNLDANCTIEGNKNKQKYIDVEEKTNSQKIKNAVNATKDMVMTENDELKDLNSNDWGLNQTEALSLINKNNNYEYVIKHYYGQSVSVTLNKIQLPGINEYLNPTRYINCTSPYGNRKNPITEKNEHHDGLDISIAEGEPIYAANSGKIVEVEKEVTQINDCEYGYGNYVKIKHEDGTTTKYAHMKYGSIPDKIEEGYEIERGEQIGQMGSTGCSTGPHLHYEIRGPWGFLKDPVEYLDISGSSGTCTR